MWSVGPGVSEEQVMLFSMRPSELSCHSCKTGVRFLRIASVLATVFLVGCDREPRDQAPVAPVVALAPADLVLVNGGIYTVDEERSWAEAAAVRGGVFVAVGDRADMEALIGPETQLIDLAGRLALPGFHDAHVHPRMGGMALLGCNLEGLDSVDAILTRVATCADSGEGWIRGYAFDLGLFGQDGPHRSLLDAVTGDRPAFLEAADGHNAWVNSRALELAGISASTPAPEMGVIEHDPDGSPSGTLRESAMALVTDAMPVASPEEDVAALAEGIRHLNAFGITSFIDASVGESDYIAYDTLARRGALSARALTSLTWGPAYARHTGEDFERVLRERLQYESERFHTGSIKIFLDGVLEGETAALVEPYLNMGHHQGQSIVEPGALAEAVTRFDAMGLQVHMHAIGDRAVREGLDAIAAARRANGDRDNRHHIAHLQLIHPDDISRFAALNVAANFQALWAYPDDFIVNLNLPVVGEARVQRMYPIASVQRGGGRIVGGSDWNVSSANPLDAIETALLRQSPWEAGGAVLNAEERVDLETMIEAYTINAAWLMKHGDRVGSIEVGKRADVVVLDRNLFTLPTSEINEARVLITLLDGEPVPAN
jgi:predicted amidohydrolase YtcJ